MKFMQLFKVVNISFKKTSFITFFMIVSYEFYIKLKKIFDPVKIIYWKLLPHCPAI